MLNLNAMLVLNDERNEKNWIVNSKEALTLQEESLNYTIMADYKLNEWEYKGFEHLENGYIGHKYMDTEGFERVITERLWTSGQQLLSNLWLD